MFMKRLIYRDPNSSAGGSAPATGGNTPPASPAAPANSAPAARSGEAIFTSFQESLTKALSKKDPQSSQPPQSGKETPPAVTGSEGEAAGQDDESKEPVTTAKPEGETTLGEEQEGDEAKGWTEEEHTELKAHGLDKLAHSPEGRALLKSFREARAEKDRLATSNANVVTRNSQLEAALASGDAKALQEMGFDLKLDQRTPDKIIEEIETDFNHVKGALEPLYKELLASNPEIANSLKRAFDKIAGKYNDRASVIQREQEWQERESRILEKAGVKPSTPATYTKLKGQAETHLTALVQQDPEASKYFKQLEAETKPGGALHALGINLAKAYGTSPETARMMNEMGKGLYFARNQKTILEGERKKWDKDREKRALTHGGGGGHAPTPAAGTPSRASSLRAGMQSMMGKS